MNDHQTPTEQLFCRSTAVICYFEWKTNKTEKRRLCLMTVQKQLILILQKLEVQHIQKF